MLIAIAALALIAALSTTAAYGAFTSPLQLSAPGDVGQPQVATDAEGDSVAVWAAPANGGGHKAVFRQISADGTLGPVRLSAISLETSAAVRSLPPPRAAPQSWRGLAAATSPTCGRSGQVERWAMS